MIFKELKPAAFEAEVAKLVTTRGWRSHDKTNKENVNQLNNYYEGRQLEYLKDGYGFWDKIEKKWVIAPSYLNITKKILDKISMVYKYPPDRVLTDADGKELKDDGAVYSQWVNYVEIFDNYIGEAERRKNLHHKILFRNSYNALEQKWRFWIEDDYLAHFLQDDPINPVGFSIPVIIQVDKEHEVSGVDQIYQFFSDKYYFYYNTKGKYWTYFYDANGEKQDHCGENPYGVSPWAEIRKGVPVSRYETDGAADLIHANESINVNLNNLNMALHYQAFGLIWDNTGLDESDAPKILIGANKHFHLPTDSTLNNLDLNPKLLEMIDTIRYEIQAIANMYHLNVNWHQEATPVSGFSLIVQNIDYLEERQKSADEANKQEKQIFKSIKAIQNYHSGDLAEDEPKIPKESYLRTDFQEENLPIKQTDELAIRTWNIKTNCKTPVDYIMSENPDMDKETAIAKFKENQALNKELSESDQIREDIKALGGKVEE